MKLKERLIIAEYLLLLTVRCLPESIIRDMILAYFKFRLAKSKKED